MFQVRPSRLLSAVILSACCLTPGCGGPATGSGGPSATSPSSGPLEEMACEAALIAEVLGHRTGGMLLLDGASPLCQRAALGIVRRLEPHGYDVFPLAPAFEREDRTCPGRCGPLPPATAVTARFVGDVTHLVERWSAPCHDRSPRAIPRELSTCPSFEGCVRVSMARRHAAGGSFNSVDLACREGAWLVHEPMLFGVW